MITLHTLTPSAKRSRTKRVGRGNSSGKGTTAGRGTKGQRARTGGRNKALRRSLRALIERTPKVRGFRSITPKMAAVPLATIIAMAKPGEIITPALLVERGVVGRVRSGLKIVGNAKTAKKLTIKAHAFSAGAKAAIESAGGTVVIIKR